MKLKNSLLKRNILVFTVVFVAIAFAFLYTVDAQQLAGTPETKDGILFRVSGGGLKKPSYIFGTIHLICSEKIFGLDELRNYIRKTDQVVMEIDLNDKKAITESLLKSKQATKTNPDQLKSLRSSLTTEEFEHASKIVAGKAGINLEDYGSLPTGIALLMLMQQPKLYNCQKLDSYEISLQTITNNEKKPLVGLETYSEQIALILNLAGSNEGENDPGKVFIKFVDNIDSSVNSLNNVVGAYRAQDLAAIAEALKPENKKEEATYFALLDKRNIAWVPKLISLFEAKPSFAAFGAGHLAGKNGVVELLRERGYTVEPIRLRISGADTKSAVKSKSENAISEN
ncbi:MAG: TraB/GumN family protein [Pyrinomonadaceae bacterium]